MKKSISVILSVILIFSMMLSLSSCSKANEMTEENIYKAVDQATLGLINFDTELLEKYVESSTLTYILKFASRHEQFATLGRAIFKNLEVTVESVDVANQTVTVNVSNKDLNEAADTFAAKLLSKYSGFELLAKLDNEEFLDKSLGELTELIDKSELKTSATVTLKVKQGKKNLVLYYDDEAENAVSGGALKAITNLTP